MCAILLEKGDKNNKKSTTTTITKNKNNEKGSKEMENIQISIVVLSMVLLSALVENIVYRNSQDIVSNGGLLLSNAI